MSDEQSIGSKQTFVPPTDRPEVKLTPARPLSDLRVRDLDVILGKQTATRQESREPVDRPKNCPFIYRHIAKPSAEFTGCDLSDLTDAPSIQQVIDPHLSSEQTLEALSPPAPSSVGSENWSGARLTKKGGDPGDPDNPKDGAFKSVWATWTLPQVEPGASGSSVEWRSVSWVGIGGGGAWKDTMGSTPTKRWSPDVLQAGFAHNISLDSENNPVPHYEGWFAWDPGLEPSDPDYMAHFQKADIPACVGDVVFVKVEYKRGVEVAFIEFVNYTQNETCSVNIPLRTSSARVVDQFRGDTIEWVLERPYDGTKYYELANYTAIDFMSAAGETYGGSIVIPVQGDLINMPNSAATLISPYTLHVEYSP